MGLTLNVKYLTTNFNNDFRIICERIDIFDLIIMTLWKKVPISMVVDDNYRIVSILVFYEQKQNDRSKTHLIWFGVCE